MSVCHFSVPVELSVRRPGLNLLLAFFIPRFGELVRQITESVPSVWSGTKAV